MSDDEDKLLAVLAKLGAPKHLISLDLHLKANAIATCNVTYHPEDGKGGLLIDRTSDSVLAIIAEEFVLVRRKRMEKLPLLPGDSQERERYVKGWNAAIDFMLKVMR